MTTNALVILNGTERSEVSLDMPVGDFPLLLRSFANAQDDKFAELSY